MTELNARGGKQGNDSTTKGDPDVGRVVGASRRTEEGGTSSREAGEQGQHPNRIDGSENPKSGDAALESHESGVWNKEREAEAEAGTGLGNPDEKV